MATFALVHGAWHGAWCWELLAVELRRRGHQVVAVDLPTADPSAGAARCAEIVLAELDGAAAPDDAVVVGHSLGGLTIPLVAAARPVARLVFLCAFSPVPGTSMAQQAREDDVFSPSWPALAARQDRGPDGTTSWPADAAVDAFFHDVPPDVAAWAAARLRPQAWKAFDEPTPLVAWPDVACQSIVCADDRVVSPAWSRRVARERFGVDPVELAGGHSPMLSRPAALADVLTASA